MDKGLFKYRDSFTQKRLGINKILKLEGLVRCCVLDPNSEFGFVTCYVEKKKEYILYKINRISKSVVWQSATVNGGYGTLAFNRKVIIMLQNFSGIVAFDVKEGKRVWEYEFGARCRSSVTYFGKCFFVSAGDSIYSFDETGELINSVSILGACLFGQLYVDESKVITYLTRPSQDGESSVFIGAVSTSTWELTTEIPLGLGSVISTDTSGLDYDQDSIYCCGENVILSLDRETLDVNWKKVILNTYLNRHKPTEDNADIFITCIKTGIFCLSKVDGQIKWKTATNEMVVTPVSILGSDLICFSADGVIYTILRETGLFFESIPIGHSPYSALTFMGENAFIGGGDPPYHGRLYVFDVLSRTEVLSYITKLETSQQEKLGSISLMGQLEISNANDEIIEIRLNTMNVTENEMEIVADSPSYNHFVFEIPLRPSIVKGLYVVDILIRTKSSGIVYRSEILHVERITELPNKKILDIKNIVQETALDSGSAVVQMIRSYYEEPVPEQRELRKIVDYVKEKSGYLSFDIWRIILRRALTGRHRSLKELVDSDEKSQK